MAFKSDQRPEEGKDHKAIEAMIVEFEVKLDRLKILYEQYFMGIEKREPTVPLKDVVRVMRALELEQIRNTGLRFRYRNLVQKLNTYRTYWNRTLREIEKGTYHRDLARLRRKMAREGIEMPTLGKMRTVSDVERAMADAAEAKNLQSKRREDDTDRMQVPSPTAGVRGASADDLRRRVSGEPAPAPALGALDLDDVDEDEQTGRHPSGFFSPRPAPRPSAQAGEPGDLPPAPRTPSSPDMGRTPSSPQMRRGSSPDVRRGSSPDVRRGSSPQMRRGSSPDMGRTPSSPNVGRRTGRGPDDSEIQSLYKRFVRAKQLCGEDTSGVKLDSLKKSIEHQLPKIRKMYEGRDVEFQVVIRSGRAILKAKPK